MWYNPPKWEGGRKLGRPLCQYTWFQRWLLWLLLALLVTDCGSPVEPTAAVRPTPDPVSIYIMLTDKYTSPSAIALVYGMSADDAARRLRALQAIVPPSGLEDIHNLAIDAYRYICSGKLLLPGADNVLRAEAYFLIDWGIALLWDYREKIDRWVL